MRIKPSPRHTGSIYGSMLGEDDGENHPDAAGGDQYRIEPLEQVMKTNSGKSVLLVLFMAAVIGCSKQSDVSQATTSAPAQVAKAEAQPAEPPKPEPKKKVPVSEIDFSKHSGVIRQGAFGYYFGLTPEQIQAAGIELETFSTDGGIAAYQTVAAPLPWDGAEYYTLAFAKNSLVKIFAVGKTITGDSTGSDGKEAYKVLTTALIEKYGKPKRSIHKTGMRLYQNRDEFYQCLAYDGCGLWVDLFESHDRAILIQLKGLRRGEGIIHLSYEARPEWEEALDQNRVAKKEATKKGL